MEVDTAFVIPSEGALFILFASAESIGTASAYNIIIQGLSIKHSGTINHSITAQANAVKQFTCHSTPAFRKLLQGWGLLPLNWRGKKIWNQTAKWILIQQAFCQEKMSVSGLEMGWNQIVKLYFVHIYEMLQFDIVIRLVIDGGEEAHTSHRHWSSPWTLELHCPLPSFQHTQQRKTQPAFSECIRKQAKHLRMQFRHVG